jgi:TonB family protein
MPLPRISRRIAIAGLFIVVAHFAVRDASAQKAQFGIPRVTLDQMMLAAPRPEYPAEALRRHLTGRGSFKLTVRTETGIVTHVAVIKSTGSKVLDDAAIAAFSHWRARPGKVDAITVPVTFTFGR